tara:strand:- start:1205 stop:1438 length:234 start_codon:yes stop_codon:yes gene_type:complete
MNKQKDFFEMVCPEENVLRKVYAGWEMNILDAEADPFVCKFDGSDCVQIDTEHSNYVALTRSNLQFILHHLDKIDKY